MPLFNELKLHKVLGCGKTRSVWLTSDKNALKLSHIFHNGTTNRMEWAIWHHAEPELKKILVPPISIHENGIYMVVTLGEPIKRNEVPKIFPSFITDPKSSNWVRVGNKILLADYAQGGIVTHLGLDSKKLHDETIPVEELCRK